MNKSKKHYTAKNRVFDIETGASLNIEDNIIALIHKCSICKKFACLTDENNTFCKSYCCLVHTKCLSSYLPVQSFDFQYTIFCGKCRQLKKEKLKDTLQ